MRSPYSFSRRAASAWAVGSGIEPSTASDSTSRSSIRYSGGGRMSAVTSLDTRARCAASVVPAAPHIEVAVSTPEASRPEAINSRSRLRRDFMADAFVLFDWLLGSPESGTSRFSAANQYK